MLRRSWSSTEGCSLLKPSHRHLVRLRQVSSSFIYLLLSVRWWHVQSFVLIPGEDFYLSGTNSEKLNSVNSEMSACLFSCCFYRNCVMVLARVGVAQILWVWKDMPSPWLWPSCRHSAFILHLSSICPTPLPSLYSNMPRITYLIVCWPNSFYMCN